MVEAQLDVAGEGSSQLGSDWPERGRADQLRVLAQRLERFLHAQIDRLERAGEQGAVASDDAQLTRLLAGFQQERENWESERQHEVDRLRREGALLKEAWQRLEIEQRTLLAERELVRQSLARSSGPTLLQDAAPTPPAGSVTRTAPACNANKQDHSAWLQFQQLRREMQTYGRATT